MMDSCTSSPTRKFSRVNSPNRRAGSLVSVLSPSKRVESNCSSRRLSRTSAPGSRRVSQGPSRRVSLVDVCSEADAEKEAMVAAEEAARMLLEFQRREAETEENQILFEK